MSGIFQESYDASNLTEALSQEGKQQNQDTSASEPATEVEVEVVDEPEVLDEIPAPANDGSAQIIAELQEQIKRMGAEFENFRRRQQDEMKRRQVLMKEELFKEVLPIVDNLDRSLEAAKNQSSLEAMMKGVELVRRGFTRLFENNEISEIPAAGQTFDPSLHEAMMVEESSEVPDQTILAELQKGYKLGDRVLRPSMVKVSRK